MLQELERLVREGVPVAEPPEEEESELDAAEETCAGARQKAEAATMRKKEECCMSEREWAVQVDDPEIVRKLRLALNAFDQQGRSANLKVANAAPYLVDRFRGLRVEVFSNEHPPPHFRVKCGGATANYRISDGFS